MAKRRRTDQGTVVDLDQVLLELFAGQRLLEPAEVKLPDNPAVRPVAARPAASAKGEWQKSGAGRLPAPG